MTDSKENIQQESTGSSLDSLFSPTNFGGEEVKASEGENVETEATGDTTSTEEVVEPSELETLQDKFNSLEKRFGDTQKWGNESNQKLASLVEKAKTNEWLSEDEIGELNISIPETDQAKLAQRLNEELPTAISVAAEVTGKSVDEMNKSVEAFTSLVDFDPSIYQELQTLPANQQAAFVLKKGAELQSVYDSAVEAGGLLNLATKSLKGSDSKVNKAIKETEERVTRELEEKYAEYVSPTSKSRPKLHGSGAQNKTKPETAEVSIQNTFNGLFNR